MHERQGAKQVLEQWSQCSQDEVESFREGFRHGKANQAEEDNSDPIAAEFFKYAFDDSPEDRNRKMNHSFLPNELNLSENRDPGLKERTLQDLRKETGKYKNKFPLEFKIRVVNAQKLAKASIKEIMEATGLCKKNIERWIQQGVERKKGAGRKTTDPKMEREIVSKVLTGIRESGCLSRKGTNEKGNPGNGQRIQIKTLQSFKRVVR